MHFLLLVSTNTPIALLESKFMQSVMQFNPLEGDSLSKNVVESH